MKPTDDLRPCGCRVVRDALLAPLGLENRVGIGEKEAVEETIVATPIVAE